MFLTAAVATSGSLFFSDVMGFPPCVLCWYQRICMYPLVALLFVAIWSQDNKVIKYTLPLSVLGLFFSVYHNLIYYGVIPESLSPCREGVSCADVHIEWMGFLTIPLMSLIAFLIINTSSLIFLRKNKND
ncbi:MAG: hypothetical protein Fur0010_21620 [Bdellovibrio sp.]